MLSTFMPLCFHCVSAAALPADTPVTPATSPEAQALFAFLADHYGKHIIAGQQEGWIRNSGETYEFNYIRTTTGKLPALRSFELGDLARRPDPVRELPAIRAARNWVTQSNGIISFCWHWPAPNGSGKFYSKDTWFDLEKALKEGTPEQASLLRDLDLAAAQLEYLRAARVPVLWRPLHEMNGRWFWWGDHGPDALRRLWHLMFQRLTLTHKLNNLLWVFSPGASTDLALWYPGDAYVDLIGYDHYTMQPTLAPAKDVFDELTRLVGGRKILAMSENAQLPDLERVFGEGAVWAYFTTWSGEFVRKTPTNQFAAIYNDPRVLTVDELPPLASYPFRTATASAKLVITAPDRLPIAAAASTPITVAVQDGTGLTVRENNRPVTLRFGGADFSAWTTNGIAEFAGVQLSAAQEAIQLQAVSDGLPPVACPISIGPGDGLTREWTINWAGRSLGQIDRR